MLPNSIFMAPSIKKKKSHFSFSFFNDINIVGPTSAYWNPVRSFIETNGAILKLS